MWARWGLVCLILGTGAASLPAQEEAKLSVTEHGVGTGIEEREFAVVE